MKLINNIEAFNKAIKKACVFFDWTLLLVIGADLLIFGLSHWLLICFILLLPYNILYFTSVHHGRNIPVKNRKKKLADKKEKMLVDHQ